MARQNAELVLAAAREELVKADGKASFLLATCGVVFGALLAAPPDGAWTPRVLATPANWVWWAGMAAASAGVGALVYTIYPRTGRQGTARISCFVDVLDAQDRDIIVAFSRTDLVLLLDQIRRISQIARRKYTGIKLAIWLLSAAALCCVAALLANRMFS